MKPAICTAVCEHGRINLIIRKGERGYAAFAAVLNSIDEDGHLSWYGDVRAADGKEQSGLIITAPVEKA